MSRLQDLRELLTDTDECILWPYAKNARGYGRLRVGTEIQRAHRQAYLETYGTLPELLRHTCDTTSCINPKHLEEGTQAENMTDMRQRCRSRRYADLTAAQVREIVQLRGLKTQAEIARLYGIAANRVCRIQLQETDR